MHPCFDLYKVDFDGSAEWLGSVQSYSVALLEIELIAARAPGDYAIVNRQTRRPVNRNRIQRRTRKIAPASA
jgi:hypothetical protein